MKDLGREIERRADQTVGASEVLAGAKVHEDDAAAGFAHDVLRLDVAVQEARTVDRGKRGADVESDERGLARAERTTRLDDLVERLAADELGPQTLAALVFLGAVHLDDVLVAKAGQTAGLFHDACVRVFDCAASRQRSHPDRSSFSATSRWSSESQARNTSQDVPLPIGSSRTRRPQRRPSEAGGTTRGVSTSAELSGMLRWRAAMLSTRRRCRTRRRSRAAAPASAACQSTGLPSATDAARSASARSSALNGRDPQASGIDSVVKV